MERMDRFMASIVVTASTLTTKLTGLHTLNVYPLCRHIIPQQGSFEKIEAELLGLRLITLVSAILKLNQRGIKLNLH